MGQRGPQAKPVELKLLEGNRGHRPVDLSTVFRPQVGVPDVPRWLSKEARKAWKRLSEELARYNLISTVDREAFAMLCQTIGRVEQIETSINKKQALLLEQGKDITDALMDTTPNGLRIQSALYQLLNKEQAKLHQLLRSFGLRPDARAAVTTAIRMQAQLFDAGGTPTPAAAPAATPAALPDTPRSFDEF